MGRVYRRRGCRGRKASLWCKGGGEMGEGWGNGLCTLMVCLVVANGNGNGKGGVL